MQQHLSRLAGVWAGALALAVAAHVRAQPVVGPRAEVDRPVVVGAVGDQTVPAAAYGGGGAFFVAWRTALWEGEVRVARLTAAGEAREPRGVLLPGLQGFDARLAVAAGGGGVVVVSAGEGRLRAVGLSGGAAEPTLVPGPATELAAAPEEDFARPAAAWNGVSFWVAWSQSKAGIAARRVDGQGRPLDPAAVVLSPSAGQPALAWDGQRTLAVWTTVAEGRVLARAVRLDGEGRVVDPQPIELGAWPGTRAGPTAVAWNGTLFLAAAAAEGGTAGAALIGAVRVAADGQPADAAPLPLGQLASAPEGGPAVAWDGQRFVVLWGEAAPATAGGPPGTRVVTPDGRLVAADGTVGPLGLPGLGAAGEQPAVVAGDGQAVVFLARPPGGRGDLDIRGVRLGDQGAAAGPDFLVSGGANWQGDPALAAGGPPGARRLLLAWQDMGADRLNGDIHAALLDESGKPIDGPPLVLASGLAAQQAPEVAWDGRHFQVVWKETGRGLVTTRVTSDGQLVDQPPLLVPGTADRQALSDPVMCGDDAGAVLVWSGRRLAGAVGAVRADLHVARLAPGGSLRDTPSSAWLATHDVSEAPLLQLACARQSALLIWSGLYERDRSDAPDLQMALIARAGELAAPGVRLIERRAADEGPSVASDGRGFLVAWRPRQQNGARVAISGTRVDAAGMGLDRPARPLGSLNAGHRVSSYWDGRQYVLVGIQSLDINNFQLRGRRVSADLGAVDPDWFPIDRISTSRGTGTLPITVPVGTGAAVVAYESFADEDATGNQRLYTRSLTTPLLEAAAGDAGADGGAAPDGDAAPADGPARAGGGGCSCRAGAASGPASGSWALLLLVGLWRARRSRKHF